MRAGIAPAVPAECYLSLKEPGGSEQKPRRVIAETSLQLCCPKCRAPGLSKTEYRYPVLGYSEHELACIVCGLSLWPQASESPNQTYYRWLMDRALGW